MTNAQDAVRQILIAKTIFGIAMNADTNGDLTVTIYH